jgi:hypothetical protein
MIRFALVLGILILPLPALSVEPSSRPEDLERITRPPGVARSAYDLVVLRPLGFLQVVVGAAVALPAYPVSLLFDGEDDVWRACVAEPVERTFRRPLGSL